MRPSPFTGRRVIGRIAALDPTARILVIDTGGGTLGLAVPPGAEVRLNDELVRLRLLQAGDRVCIDLSGEEQSVVSVWAASG